MKIRFAQINDYKIIAQNTVNLAGESENKNISQKIALEGVKSIILNKNKGFILIAEENKEIIGQLMITYEWSDWSNKNIWWIQSLYVVKEWRKKGIFTQLLKKVEKLALKNNIKTIRLYVHKENKTAINVYKNLEMVKAPYHIYELIFD